MAARRQEWAVLDMTGLTLLRATSVGFSLPNPSPTALFHRALAVCVLGPKSPVLKIRLRLSLASELEARLELLSVSYSPPLVSPA